MRCTLLQQLFNEGHLYVYQLGTADEVQSSYLPRSAFETGYRPCRRAPDKVGGRETWRRVVQLYMVSEERVVGAFDNDVPSAVPSGLHYCGICSRLSSPPVGLLQHISLSTTTPAQLWLLATWLISYPSQLHGALAGSQ